MNERSSLVGFSSSGAWVGNIIALPFGGYLCENGFDGGWASMFYIFGKRVAQFQNQIQIFSFKNKELS